MRAVLQDPHAEVESVLNEIMELLAAERAEEGRTDAAGSWRSARAQELLRSAARKSAKRLWPRQLHEVAAKFGKKTDEHARRQLDQQLRSAMAIPLSSVEKPTQDRIGGWVAENVALIQTVPERYFDRLQEDVQEAFARGAAPDVLAREMRDRYGMAERDADRIAIDQTLKLASDVNHDRLKSLGVARARWRTMRDERVSSDCRALEGQVYDLAKGIDGRFPGKEHPRCRCWPEPIFDDLL